MKPHKKNLQILINDVIHDEFHEISPQLQSRLSKAISEVVVQYNTSTAKDFVNAHHELALKYEVNRKYISDFARMVVKNTENLLNIYKENQFAKVEFDQKSNKPVLIYKTKMLKETCEFINALNNMVVEYNSRVMEYNEENIKKEQLSLF
jgi:hypothetical protein